MLHVVHSVPGRVRLQSDHLRGNVLVMEAAQARLVEIDGVLSARSNWATGSIVIHYCPQRLSSKILWDRLRETDFVSAKVGPAAQVAVSGQQLGELVADTVSQTLVRTVVSRSTAALIGALV